jgi:hypothetical protein
MVISRHIDPPVGIQQARYQAKEHFVDSALVAPVAAQLARPIPSRDQRERVRHTNNTLRQLSQRLLVGPYLDAVAYH